jgi:hypothetical protein
MVNYSKRISQKKERHATAYNNGEKNEREEFIFINTEENKSLNISEEKRL